MSHGCCSKVPQRFSADQITLHTVHLCPRENCWHSVHKIGSAVACTQVSESISQVTLVSLVAGETHPGAALQDILRLLTLWFNHGSAPDVEAALQEGFGHVSIDTWLVVIPQVCNWACAVLCCAVLCCAVLCCAVLCCAVLCCAVLCCFVLRCAAPCPATLCCTTLLALPHASTCVLEDTRADGSHCMTYACSSTYQMWNPALNFAFFDAVDFAGGGMLARNKASSMGTPP